MQKNVAYFFSDVHLGVFPDKAVKNREEKLLECLKSCAENASHIVFIGDLFEFWYEYKYYVSREHFSLYRVLGDLVDAGVEIHYLMGNHDFALEDFFEKTLGVKTSKNLILETQGKRLYLEHGDGLASSDKGYRFIRRILDFPLNRKLFRLIHPDFGMSLAHFVGRNSRKYGESKIIQLEEYLQKGNQVMQETHSDFFVQGHHHIPGIWNVSNGIVASPGQWLFSLNYLKLENGALELMNWI